MKATKLNLAKLKIKVKSLAEEARIIRKEEKNFFGYNRQVLAEHRRWDVRNECRATQLAIAFLKGVSYKKIEPSCKEPMKRVVYITPRVVTMASKYGEEKISKQDILDWMKE